MDKTEKKIFKFSQMDRTEKKMISTKLTVAPVKVQKQILDAIYINDLMDFQSLTAVNYDLNFKCEHPHTDLDDQITPLCAAAYLGRLEMVMQMMENKYLDLNLGTNESGFTPLIAATLAGNYEIMQLLLEGGAHVDGPTSSGQTPLAYCFARLDEEVNMFENKNLCLKMAELLLQFGADINTLVNPSEEYTLLMQFAGLSMELSPFQAEVNIDVIQFLLEHGADRNRRSKSGEKAWDLAKKNTQRPSIQKLLTDVKQKYFHPNERAIPLRELHEDNNYIPGEIKIESTSVNCGCFSCYK